MFNALYGRKRIDGPSPAEQRILPPLLKGATDREIAALIHRSEDTVRSHIESLCHKLNARNRTHLAVTVVRQNLMEV